MMVITKSEWDDSQKNELAFWKSQFESGNEEQKARWNWYSQWVFKHYFSNTSFLDKVVMDLGSGPNGICTHIAAKRKYAVDPLMRLFIDIGYDVYANMTNPVECHAEQISVGHLGEWPDVVFCLNCLDHCRDPYMVLQSIHEILPSGGSLVLCCDMRPAELIDAYHKIQITENWLKSALQTIGFRGDSWLVPHQTGNPTVQFCGVFRRD